MGKTCRHAASFYDTPLVVRHLRLQDVPFGQSLGTKRPPICRSRLARACRGRDGGSGTRIVPTACRLRWPSRSAHTSVVPARSASPVSPAGPAPGSGSPARPVSAPRFAAGRVGRRRSTLLPQPADGSIPLGQLRGQVGDLSFQFGDATALLLDDLSASSFCQWDDGLLSHSTEP